MDFDGKQHFGAAALMGGSFFCGRFIILGSPDLKRLACGI
jgi:hypothetical protein